MADVSDITPEVDDVGGLISARTADVSGDEQNTFTGDTRPTNQQASNLCDLAARDVFLALGVEVLDDALVADALQIAALRAAILIELSFYPEASTDTVKTLGATYLAGLAALQERLHWSPVRLT